jgi:hypothetical protein
MLTVIYQAALGAGLPRLVLSISVLLLSLFLILRRRHDDWHPNARRGLANVMCGIPRFT